MNFQELPVKNLVPLARIILESNYFEFDEEIFRQKLGTAIGSKFAAGFANIFIGYLEGKFLDSCELRPWVYGLHLEEDLNTFLCRLSGFH